MSLQTRLASLISAIGADIKALQNASGYVEMPADVKRTTTTITNDLSLNFPLIVGATYIFDIVLFVIGDFTGDIKFQMNGPTGCTINMHSIGPHNTDLSAGSSANGEWIARADGTTATAITPIGTSTSLIGIRIQGRITNITASASTCYFAWAQNTSTATGTTIKAGSFLEWRRVA